VVSDLWGALTPTGWAASTPTDRGHAQLRYAIHARASPHTLVLQPLRGTARPGAARVRAAQPASDAGASSITPPRTNCASSEPPSPWALGGPHLAPRHSHTATRHPPLATRRTTACGPSDCRSPMTRVG
jgi:hypothetical protein